MKRVIALVALTILTFTGCGMSSGKLAEYYSMKSAYDEISYTVDTNKYTSAVLFLINPEIVFTEFIEENAESFSDIIDDTLMIQVRAKSNKKEAAKDSGDKFTNLEEEQYKNENKIEVIDEYGHPIYGTHYEIINYGTKEESEQSLIDFNALPDNTVMSVSIYKDMVIYRVDNKYYGEYMVRIKLNNNKIIDYSIFM